MHAPPDLFTLRNHQDHIKEVGYVEERVHCKPVFSSLGLDFLPVSKV